jgi:hypothetical protein
MINDCREEIEKVIDLEYEQKKNQRYSSKEEIVKWLSGFNTKYHLTLTFPKHMDEKWSRKLLNQSLAHLNRKTFKNRYGRGESFISGFAIREKTYGMNNDHYHILLHENKWLPERDEMTAFLNKQVKYFRSDHERGVMKKQYIYDYYLQDYYNEGDDGLENYLSKKFEFLSVPLQEGYDSIGTLDKNGVVFGREEFNR